MSEPRRNDGPQREEFRGGTSPRRPLTQEQRRAPDLLASDPRRVTEALMLATGTTVATLAGLVRAGIATAQGKVGKGWLIIAPGQGAGEYPIVLSRVWL